MAGAGTQSGPLREAGCDSGPFAAVADTGASEKHVGGSRDEMVVLPLLE